MWSLGIQLQEGSLTFGKVNVEIIAIKSERTQIYLLRDVLVAVASLDLKVPIDPTRAPFLYSR